MDIILEYGSVATVVSLSALGAGVGGSIAARAALDAVMRAPQANGAISRALILGLALIETGAIIAMVIAILLLSTPSPAEHLHYNALARCGIALALGICALSVGIAGASAIAEAFQSMARQPFFSGKIFNLMLITQSIIQTPVIFAFLVSLMIYSQLGSVDNIVSSIRLLCAGLCIGIGSIGPVVGLAHFSRAALRALGINREIYPELLPFSFVSQAIIETPIIFALVVAILIVFVPPHHAAPLIGIASGIGAALAIALGTLMPGISSGKTVAAACNAMAYSPQSAQQLSRISILVQGLIDTSAIYTLLVSIMCLIFG